MKETARRSRSLRATAIGAATALCVTTVVLAPTGAWADESAPSATEVVVEESLSNLDGSLLLTPVDSSGVGEVELAEGSVDVPVDLAEGVSITGADSSFLIDLPAAGEAAEATVLDDGTVTYPAEDFANSVVVSDVGVQMLTTITGPDAPLSYSYDVSLEPGQTLQLVDTGAAVVNADGTIALAVAGGWAKDAHGADVATHYEVNGSTLTQYVDHTADGVAYPVVADPIWLAPWIVRCLIGIGLNGPQISRIASMGSPGSILAAFGFAALRCVLGR